MNRLAIYPKNGIKPYIFKNPGSRNRIPNTITKPGRKCTQKKRKTMIYDFGACLEP
jgi:hypothetical protein